MHLAKPMTMKRSLTTLGGKAGSLLPSPSYLILAHLIPTSHPPWQKGGREVWSATSPPKTEASSGIVVMGDKMNRVQAGTGK